MKALVVYCHPRDESFTSAVKDVVINSLNGADVETRICDLYANDFSPALTAAELEGYLDCPGNQEIVADDVADIQWCDTLIFIYPTWWYGLPAVLKGWLDRVLLPDVAFMMPDTENKDIRPGLTHIKRMAVFTTCGASRWLTFFVGAPGKRTLMRGVGLLCARPLKRVFAAH
ncbi:MAG: NAD(P)H-dependent oxidoreductase [Boseongicola sp.]|nr:NAD(P)H-dependent oxidoreductase [Boseongicola sp.]